MNRVDPHGALRLIVLVACLGAAAPVLAQPTFAEVQPPVDIVFRDPFIGRNAVVFNTNVSPPDTIIFRQPFIRREGGPVATDLAPPPGIVFREPFVGREPSSLQEDVTAPAGIVFRDPFISREGFVIEEFLPPPSGIVFRDLFVYRDGNVVAAPSAVPSRLIDKALVLPNPFNPSTQISFRLNQDATVSVAVYDARGRHVRTLFQGAMSSDLHVMQWDGADDAGRPVASGVYLVRIAGGGETVVVKGVLVE